MNMLTPATLQEVISHPGYTLVQMMTPGCPNCKMNAQWLDTHASDFHQAIPVYGVVVDEALARQYEVTHAPTCFLFKDGVAEAKTQMMGPDLAAAVNLLLDTGVKVV